MSMRPRSYVTGALACGLLFSAFAAAARSRATEQQKGSAAGQRRQRRAAAEEVEQRKARGEAAETETEAETEERKDEDKEGEANGDAILQESSCITVMGSGASSGVPRSVCLMNPSNNCMVCVDSQRGRAKQNRNNRLNPCLLIRLRREDGTVVAISVDAGKTHRLACVRWLPDLAVRGLDAVLLTHSHADAMMGLDDLRSTQIFNAGHFGAKPIRIFSDAHTFSAVARCFNYLVAPEYKKPKFADVIYPAAAAKEKGKGEGEGEEGGGEEGGGEEETKTAESSVKFTRALSEPVPVVLDAKAGPGAGEQKQQQQQQKKKKKTASGSAEVRDLVPRKVAQLEFYELRHFQAFRCEGLLVTPLPVFHGGQFKCTAFAFGERRDVVYLSDISRLPIETLRVLAQHQRERAGAPIRLLVVDSLFAPPLATHSTHWCWTQTMQAVARLRPRRALLMGLSDSYDYREHTLCCAEWNRRHARAMRLPEKEYRQERADALSWLRYASATAPSRSAGAVELSILDDGVFFPPRFSSFPENSARGASPPEQLAFSRNLARKDAELRRSVLRGDEPATSELVELLRVFARGRHDSTVEMAYDGLRVGGVDLMSCG